MKQEKFTLKRQLAQHAWDHLQSAIRDSEKQGIDHLLGTVGTPEFSREIITSFYEKYDLEIPESLKPNVEQQKLNARAATSPIAGMLKAKEPKAFQDNSHDKYNIIAADFKLYQECVQKIERAVEKRKKKTKSNEKKSKKEEKLEKRREEFVKKILVDLDTDGIVNALAGTFISALINDIIIAISPDRTRADYMRQPDQYAEKVLIAQGAEDCTKSNKMFSDLRQQCEAVTAISPILRTMPAEVTRILGNKTEIVQEDIPALCNLASERHKEMDTWLNSAVASSSRPKEMLEEQKCFNETASKAVDSLLHHDENSKNGADKELTDDKGYCRIWGENPSENGQNQSQPNRSQFEAKRILQASGEAFRTPPSRPSHRKTASASDNEKNHKKEITQNNKKSWRKSIEGNTKKEENTNRNFISRTENPQGSDEGKSELHPRKRLQRSLSGRADSLSSPRPGGDVSSYKKEKRKSAEYKSQQTDKEKSDPTQDTGERKNGNYLSKLLSRSTNGHGENGHDKDRGRGRGRGVFGLF